MNWILLGLLAINLLLLVWLLLRPTPSPDAALAQWAQDLKSHGDGRQAQLERELRDELQRSASGTR